MADQPTHLDYMLAYSFAGWAPIALPAGEKFPPPQGYTGAGAPRADTAQLAAWAREYGPACNVGVRMPEDVVGIDVDEYGDKHGAQTLAELERRLGVLPDTWSSSARPLGPDGAAPVSRIRFYRLSEPAARLAGGAGPDIDVIQAAHRYAVVWPSVHPSGREYRWFDPSGAEAGRIPLTGELAALPEAWREDLVSRASSSTPEPSSASAGASLLDALLQRDEDVPPCHETHSTLLSAAERMTEAHPGGRHDTVTGLTYRVVAEAAAGHRGFEIAVERLRAMWDAATHGEGRSAEFDVMLDTAARKVATEHPEPSQADACALLTPSVPREAVGAPAVAQPAGTTEPVAPITLEPKETLFDPPGSVTDLELAGAVLDWHGAHSVRYLTDEGLIIRPGRYAWQYPDSRSPDTALRSLVLECASVTPRGSADKTASVEEQQRAFRRKRLHSSAGAGAVVQQARGVLLRPGSPWAVARAELDAEDTVLWAGGVPWDLAASVDRPVRADIAEDTPHLLGTDVLPVPGETPLWDAYLRAVLPDEEQRAWVRILLGACITGTSDRLMPVLWGASGVGKTQLVALMCDAMGAYAVAPDASLLDRDTPPWALAALQGARLVYVDEGPRTSWWGREKLKQLTGGGSITGAAKYRGPVTFRATHTLVMTTNDIPDVGDPALVARLRSVHCVGDPAEVAAARRAIGRLSGPAWQAERGAVLADLMRAAAAYLADPVGTSMQPLSAQLEVDEMMAEQDLTASWLIERTDAEGWSPSTALYADFREYARLTGTPDARIPTMRQWAIELKHRGIEKRHTKTGKQWMLRLRRFGGGGPEGGAEPPENTVTLLGDASPVRSVTGPKNVYTDGDVYSKDLTPGGAGDASVTLSVPAPGEASPGLTTGNDACDACDASTPIKAVKEKKEYIYIKKEKMGEHIELIRHPSPPTVEGGERLVLPALKVRGREPQPVGVEDAAALLATLAGSEVGLDIETSGYPVGHREFEVKSIQLGTAGFCVVLDPGVIEQRGLAARVLDAAGTVTAHSATADVIPCAELLGVSLWPKVRDTAILANLADPGEVGEEAGLKPLAARVLGPEAATATADAGRKKLFARNRWLTNTTVLTPRERNGWAMVNPAEPAMVEYAASDVLDTAELSARLVLPESLVQREHAVQRLTARVTASGLRLDLDHVRELQDRHRADSVAARATLEAAGFEDPDSSAKVARALEALGAPLPRTPTGRPSATAAVVERLAEGDPSNPATAAAVALLAYRKHTKLLSAFLDPFEEQCTQGDGRIRPTVYTLGARATGRMSCVRPNVQQLPRSGGVRGCVVPDPGHAFVSADFSGVELRVAAAVSGDVQLAQMIIDGVDLHGEIARAAWGPDATKAHRYAAKRAVFGRLYGAGVQAVARQLGEHADKVDDVLAALDAAAPGFAAFSRDLRNGVQSGAVPYWLHASGRKTWYPRTEPHKAPNYTIQSTARELLADALLRWGETWWGRCPLVPIHDELVVMVPADEAEEAATALPQVMATSLPVRGSDLVVPIVAEGGAPMYDRWRDSV